MTDGTTTPAGDPRRHWREAAGRRPGHRREPAPDLSDFAVFAARVDPRGSRWLTPALLLGTAVFCAWYSTVSSTGLLPLSPDVRRTVLWVLAGILAGAAPAVLVWDNRTRDRALRRTHGVFVEHGTVVEAYLTPLDVGNESVQLAWVLIDSRVPDEQASRLHAAFDGWLTAVLADDDAYRRVAAWLRAGGGFEPSEELFGPDAAGGYLVGPLTRGRWKVLMPKIPRFAAPVPLSEGRSWQTLPIRDLEGSTGSVPRTIGPAR